MSSKKVLIISDWIYPFTGHSQIADATRNHILCMQEAGLEIRSFMPKWGPINERRNQLHEVIRLSGMNLIIDDTDNPLIIKVASLPGGRQQVYFIDNDDFFQNRQYVADADGNEYPDNDERTIFFARGVLETVKKLRWNPDIIHCHGWMTSLIPLYIKTLYKDEPTFRDAKIISSIYDTDFKQELNPKIKEKILVKDISSDMVGDFQIPVTYNSIIRKSIDFSDGVIFSQENACQELIDYCTAQNRKFVNQGVNQLSSEDILNFYDSI